MNELVCEQVNEGVSVHKYLCSMYFNFVRCEKKNINKKKRKKVNDAIHFSLYFI